MGLADKAKNEAQKVSGVIKESVGSHTDNRDLEAEGTKDRVSGDLKNAGEKVKDAFSK